MISSYIKKALDFIYPTTCMFCNHLTKDGICKKCELKIEEELISKIENTKDVLFTKHAYIFKYKEPFRSKIIEYKFDEKPYYAKGFAKIIMQNEKICNFIKDCDIIIPVPIHKERRKTRGYNQCTLILNELRQKITTIRIEEKVLIKHKNIVPQSTLGKDERMKNINNVYKIQNEEKIKAKKILLFDDIYTTGSTVLECSKMLKQAGAAEIIVLTLAKD